MKRCAFTLTVGPERVLALADARPGITPNRIAGALIEVGLHAVARDPGLLDRALRHLHSGGGQARRAGGIR